jgi:hypothetical protein
MESMIVRINFKNGTSKTFTAVSPKCAKEFHRRYIEAAADETITLPDMGESARRDSISSVWQSYQNSPLLKRITRRIVFRLSNWLWNFNPNIQIDRLSLRPRQRDIHRVVGGLIFVALFIVPFLWTLSMVWNHAALKRHGVKTRARVLNAIFVSEKNDQNGTWQGDYSFDVPKSKSAEISPGMEMVTFTHAYGSGEKPGKEVDVRYLADNPNISEIETEFGGPAEYIAPIFMLMFAVPVFGGLSSAIIGFFTDKA